MLNDGRTCVEEPGRFLQSNCISNQDAVRQRVIDMVEIHYHLLHSTDDGPEDLDSAVALAQASIDAGVTHLVSTPHCNEQFEFNAERNRARLAELAARLGNRIHFGLGCDFHLSEENFEVFKKEPLDYTINGGKYLLVEFSDFGIPPSVDDMLLWLIDSGFVPIITHPERNSILVYGPARLQDWMKAGCLVQITAGSVIGKFGSSVKKNAKDVLDKGWVHLVASDAHGVRSRPPVLREAHAEISKQYGGALADRLCRDNPLAVFQNRAVETGPIEIVKPVVTGKNKGTILQRLLRGLAAETSSRA